MGEIHVQFEALQSGREGIERHYARLTGTLEQLEADLAPMIGSWSGSAQQAYLACKRQWDDAAQALAQVLSTIGLAVGDAHENYLAAETAARTTWS